MQVNDPHVGRHLPKEEVVDDDYVWALEDFERDDQKISEHADKAIELLNQFQDFADKVKLDMADYCRRSRTFESDKKTDEVKESMTMALNHMFDVYHQLEDLRHVIDRDISSAQRDLEENTRYV